MIFELDLRSAGVGGAVTSGVLSRVDGPTGELALDQLRLARRVVFLAHGFNVNRSEGRTKLTNLATFLGDGPDMAIVATLWPGDSVIPVLTYPLEGRVADDSAKALARFIVQRNALQAGASISVVTHSLGARVAMETLKRLLGKGYALSQMCLMAPAVVDYALSRERDYRDATLACDRVAVLSSTHDRVLQWAFPIGNLLGVFPLFRNHSVGLALGYHGARRAPFFGAPIPANVHGEAIPSVIDVGHGDYLPGFVATAPPPVLDAHDSKTALAANFAASVLRGDPNPRY